MQRIRPPAVAGQFYPASAAELAATVDRLLAAAAPPARIKPPKVLIVPHAGYIYSGPTAALAYRSLQPWRSAIRRVVLLGPTHRVAVNGLALPEADAFSTPLGEVRLDTAGMALIAALPQVVASDRVHAQEHALEVQLPFLQRQLDDFSLIPLAVGDARPETVAEVLDQLWGGPETLIVISTDLSHYLNHAAANQVDDETCRQILQLDSDIRPTQACGALPINGLLLAARQRSLQPQLIQRCNSGDTAGDKQRVVGYAAFTLDEPEHHG